MHPLLELRRALGLTQAQLAKSVSVHQSQVSSHENTGQGITAHKLLAIADKYDPAMKRIRLTPEELIRGRRRRRRKRKARPAVAS